MIFISRKDGLQVGIRAEQYSVERNHQTGETERRLSKSVWVAEFGKAIYAKNFSPYEQQYAMDFFNGIRYEVVTGPAESADFWQGNNSGIFEHDAWGATPDSKSEMIYQLGPDGQPKAAGMTEAYRRHENLGIYDTDNIADPDERLFAENSLLTNALHGHEYVMVPPRAIPEPWRGYDEIPNQGAHLKIRSMVENLNLNYGEVMRVIAYETAHQARAHVIKALEALIAEKQETAKELDALSVPA